jgi:hypothetical protein
MNTTRDILFAEKAERFLARWGTVSFWLKSLLLTVSWSNTILQHWFIAKIHSFCYTSLTRTRRFFRRLKIHTAHYIHTTFRKLLLYSSGSSTVKKFHAVFILHITSNKTVVGVTQSTSVHQIQCIRQITTLGLWFRQVTSWHFNIPNLYPSFRKSFEVQ